MSRKNKTNWTKDEDSILVDLFNQGKSLLDISISLNRSLSGIKNRLWNLKIDRSRIIEISIGDKFNRLTAVSFSHQTNKIKYWNFLCDCGKGSITRLQAVVSGRIKSCGCYAKERQKILHGLPEGTALKNELYGTYRRNAKSRKYTFDISKEFFLKIIEQNCFLCGIEPTQPGRIKNRVNAGDFKYNGIDRYDNSLGYIEENCRPCCGTCNRAKDNMSIQEFESWVKRIVEKNNVNKIES